MIIKPPLFIPGKNPPQTSELHPSTPSRPPAQPCQYLKGPKFRNFSCQNIPYCLSEWLFDLGEIKNSKIFPENTDQRIVFLEIGYISSSPHLMFI